MKKFSQKTILTLALVLFIPTLSVMGQYRYVNETFDSSVPVTWYQEQSAQTDQWIAKDGSAFLQAQSLNSVTSLVTDVIDLSDSFEPFLSFSLKSEHYAGKIDAFTVLVRPDAETRWTEIYKNTARHRDFVPVQLAIDPQFITETFQIMFMVKNNGGDGVWLDNVVVINSARCTAAPTELSLVNITRKYAEFSWKTDEKAVNSRFVVSKVPITDFGDIPSSYLLYDRKIPVDRQFGINTVTVSGLDPETAYWAYVQADCEYGDMSSWTALEFSTPCNLIRIEGFEFDFETGLSCWSMTGDVRPGLSSSYNRGNSIEFSTGVDQYSYLYTPEFDVDDISKYSLSFYIYSGSVGSADVLTDISVGILTNPADEMTFVEIGRFSPTVSSVWQRVDVSFDKYSGDDSGTKGRFVAFRAGNIDRKVSVVIDDIELHEQGTCVAPILLKADAVFAKGADISWNEPSSSVKWTVKVSKNELDIADPGFDAEGTDFSVESGKPRYSITDLEPKTEYWIYVKSECGAWTEPLVITTGETWEVGHRDNFSSYTDGTNPSMPWKAGVRCFDKPGQESRYMPKFISKDYWIDGAHEESWSDDAKFVLSLPYEFESYNGTYYSYVILPEIEVDDIKNVQLSFYLSIHPYGKTFAPLNILVCDNQEDLSTGEIINTVSCTEKGIWTKYIVTFENYSGSGKFIALSCAEFTPAVSYESYKYLYVDDIAVEERSDCNVPMALKAKVTSSSTVDLLWDALAATDWQVELTDVAANTVVGIYNSDKPELELNENMTEGTVYSVRVRSVCDVVSGVYSDWCKPVEFRTFSSIGIGYQNKFEPGDNESLVGWFLFNTGSDGYYLPSVNNTTWTGTVSADVTPNSLKFNTSGSYSGLIYAVMPAMEDGVNMNELYVQFYGFTNNYYDNVPRELSIGIVSDPNDIENTFVEIDKARLDKLKEPQIFAVSLAGYEGNGRHIAFKFGDNYNSASFFVDNIFIDKMTGCFPVTKIDVDAVSDNSATISWVKGNSENKWNVKVFDSIKTVEEVERETGNIFDGPLTDNPHTFTSLEPSVSYYISIQPVIDGTDACMGPWSVPMHFKTECLSVYTTPYIENFDNQMTNVGHDCYVIKNSSPSENAKAVIRAAEMSRPDYIQGADGGKVFEMSANNYGYTYAILPEFDKSLSELQLSFYAYSGAGSSSPAYLEIGVMNEVDWSFRSDSTYNNSITHDSLFVPVRRIDLPTRNEWYKIEVLFDGYGGVGNRIAMRTGGHRVPDGNATVIIDNLEVGDVSACTKVMDLKVSDIGTETARLTWEIRDEKNWDIRISANKQNPDATDGEWVIDEKEISTSYYNVKGLLPNTVYHAYVRRVNKTENCRGEWSDYVMFRTNCGAIDLGYTDSFEQHSIRGKEADLRCWIRIGTSTRIAYPMLHTLQSDLSTGHNPIPEDSVCLALENTSSNAMYMTSYASLPAMNVESVNECQLTFTAYRPKISGKTGGQFEIGVMTDPYDPTTYVTVWSDTVPTGVYAKYTIDFLNYTNDNYGNKGKYITFRAMPGQSSYNLDQMVENLFYIDNVEIKPFSKCVAPTFVEVVSVNENAVTLQWSSPENDKYRIIGSHYENTDPAFAILDTIVESNPCTVTGLYGNTLYFLNISPVCDDTDRYTWSETVTFRTEGCNTYLPYYETWEGLTANRYVPACYNAYSASENKYFAAGEGWSNLEIVAPEMWSGASLGKQGNALKIAADNYAFLPCETTDIRNAVIQFYAKGCIVIGAIENINDIETFVALKTIDNPTMAEVICNLSDYKDIAPESRIAIMSVTGDAYLDNILVDYADARIWTPANVQRREITHNTAHFTWDYVGDADEYEVACVLRGEQFDDNMEFETVVEKQITLNLQSDTEYDIYVRARNGDNVSSWTECYPFFTYSEPALLPYVADFDDDKDNALWRLLNAGYTNRWMIGNAVDMQNNGKALYITNDGESYEASIGKDFQSHVWASRTVYVDKPGIYNVSFVAKNPLCKADFYGSGDNNMSAFFISADYRSNGASLNNFYTGDGVGNLTSGASSNANMIADFSMLTDDWQQFFKKVQVNAPGYYQIAFYFKNTSTAVTDDYIPAAVDNISIEYSECGAPSDLKLAMVSDKQASVTWNGGDVRSWNVVLAVGDRYVDDIPTLTDDMKLEWNVTAARFDMNDLMPSQLYTLFVSPVCETEDLGYVTFKFSTVCEARPVPFKDDFSSGYEMTSGDIPCYTNGVFTSQSIGMMMQIDGLKYVALPMFDAEISDLRLIFDAANEQYADPFRFEIGVMTNPADVSTFETFAASTSPAYWDYWSPIQTKSYYYTFENYVGAGKFIAIRIPGNKDLYIDNLVVEYVPACARPYSLFVRNETSNTAELFWTASRGQSEWRIVVAESEMTSEQLDAAEKFVFDQSVSGKPKCTITGLNHSTRYYAYVQPVCESNAEWSEAVSFCTGFEVRQIPYYENFDGDNVTGDVPLAWYRADIDLDDVDSEHPMDIKASQGDGRKEFKVQTNGDTGNNTKMIGTYCYMKTIEWMISPEINISEKAALSMDMISIAPYRSSMYKLHEGMKSVVRILVSDDNGITWEKHDCVEISNDPIADYSLFVTADNWMRVFADLSKYEGKVIRFAIYIEHKGEDMRIFFDNIAIRPVEETVYDDIAFELRDYYGYGFSLDYSVMLPGEMKVTRCNTGLSEADSLIVLNLDVQPVIRIQIDTIVCENSLPYIFEDFIIPEAGMYVHKYRTSADADSIVTLIAEVDAIRDIQVTERQICQGDTVVFAGNVYSDSGTYYDSIPHPYGGCDIITALELTVLDGNDTIRIKDKINEDALPYEYEGFVLLDVGTQSDTYRDTIALAENTQCTDWLVYEIEVTKTDAYKNAVLHNLILTPNPVDAGDPILIKSEFSVSEREELIVEIFNSQGVLTDYVRPTEYPITILSPKVAGVYFIRITTATDNVYQSKLIVK